MSVARECVRHNSFGKIALIGVEIILPAMFVPVRKVYDMCIVYPGVVTAHLLQIERPYIRAVAVGSEHMGQVSAGGAVGRVQPPAVKKCDA